MSNRVFLGVLLGQYDMAQGMEQIGSWEIINGIDEGWFVLDDPTQGALDNTDYTLPDWAVDLEFQTQTTHVYSSTTGFRFDISSNGTGGHVWYNYNLADDLLDKRYGNATSHRVMSYLWGKTDTEAYSGGVTATFSAHNVSWKVPYTDSTSLHRHVFDFTMNSGDDLELRFDFDVTTTSSPKVYFDSVVTAVDVIQLQPSMAFQEFDYKNLDRVYSLGGIHTHYSYFNRKRWMMSLRHVKETEKEIINRWWKNDWNLLFTTNNSMDGNLHIVRIKNNQMPLQQLEAPYHDEWTGLLELEEVTRELVF